MAQKTRLDVTGPSFDSTTGKATIETATPAAIELPERKEAIVAKPAIVTLPQLMGKIVEACMTDRKAVAHAKKDLQLWYDAQSPEDRREFAKKLLKEMETFKLLGEAMYQEMIGITIRDING